MPHQKSTNLILIPARFIVTIGNILAIAMVKHSLDDNIKTSLYPHSQSAPFSSDAYDVYGSSHPSSYLEPYPYPRPTNYDLDYHPQYKSLKRDTNAAISVAYICLTIDMIGLLFGFTIFRRRVNFFQVMTHFVGSIWTCWFVGENHVLFI